MSTSTSTSVSTSVSTSRRLPWPGAASGSSAQRLLLGCGLAGPVLFIGTFLIEGATRPGYDAWRQAVSALGLGPGGGVQRADFIVFGLLIGLLRAACARPSRVAPPPSGRRSCRASSRWACSSTASSRPAGSISSAIA